MSIYTLFLLVLAAGIFLVLMAGGLLGRRRSSPIVHRERIVEDRRRLARESQAETGQSNSKG